MPSFPAFPVLYSFILLAALANAEDLVYSECPNDTTNTRDSAFHANLDAARGWPGK